LATRSALLVSGINLGLLISKLVMKENESGPDKHLDTPSESNREKHINFPEVEQESSENFTINKDTSDRQKQWQQEIQEGEREKSRLGQEGNSSMPMEEDDTIGIP
jgi:hypothetical protein